MANVMPRAEAELVAYKLAAEKLAEENGRLRAALTKLDADMHNTSTRPCGTCRGVTKAIGQSFGCVKLDRG